MDTKQTTVASGMSTKKPSKLEEELAKVNREMYERNLELATRNRTLSVLREIYTIINTSLGLQTTGMRVIEAIVKELNFQKGFIALYDHHKRVLSSLAVSSTNCDEQKAFENKHHPFRKFKLPLTEKDNLCIDSILHKKQHVTNDLCDVLCPLIDEREANQLSEHLNIKTSVIYPIIFGGKVLGVLVLCMDKHIGFLSRAEYETMKELIEVVAIAVERAQIYVQLKDANQRLKDLDQLKDEFVSVASHELRTPMTAIKSYLWMALAGKGGNLNDKQRYYLDRAYNSTDRLIKLVNDMLNVSRIEAGRVSLLVDKVDMNKLVEDVIFEVKPRADELKLKLKVEKKASLSKVIADPDKIKEVLINLIGNSLKFTPAGGVISVSFEEKPGFVLTHVKDTGKGVEKEDLPKLFQKFGLLKGSYTTNQVSQGTGLGLYICKSIIQLHKGEVSAYSEGRDKGAEFTFSLKTYNQEDFEKIKNEQVGKEGIEIIHTAIS